MALSVIVAGFAGSGGSPVTSLTTNSYNQIAGHCLVAIVVSFATPVGGVTALSDMAGNSWTQIFVSDVGDIGLGKINAFYVPNCKGNATNKTTLGSPWLGSSFATLTVYDIAGADISSPLDVAMSATYSSTTPTISGITTALANEAFITLIDDRAANLASATVPSSPIVFIENGEGINSAYSCAGHAVVSSIQTNISVAWSNVENSQQGAILVMSFKAAPPSPPTPSGGGLGSLGIEISLGPQGKWECF